MKKTLVTLALVAVCAGAFAQGKISFVNNANHAVYFGADGLKAADVGLANSLATSAALPSGATLLVDLYGGASAGSMTLLTTTTMSAVTPGVFGPYNFISTLPTSVQTMQVQVRESTFNTADLAFAGGGYYGFSQIFTFVPSATLAYNSIVNAGGTALSTWANGTVPIGTSLGAIQVQAVVPEPSSMALAGLGAASLLMFRRRK